MDKFCNFAGEEILSNHIMSETNNKYVQAADVIKTAILQGQYEAAKGVNRYQLATYFGVGKYVSINTKNGYWGDGALKAISDRLHKILPGLRGFSDTQLKFMRRFYETWSMLDANRLVATNDALKSVNRLVATNDALKSVISPIANGDALTKANQWA